MSKEENQTLEEIKLIRHLQYHTICVFTTLLVQIILMIITILIKISVYTTFISLVTLTHMYALLFIFKKQGCIQHNICNYCLVYSIKCFKCCGIDMLSGLLYKDHITIHNLNSLINKNHSDINEFNPNINESQTDIESRNHQRTISSKDNNFMNVYDDGSSNTPQLEIPKAAKAKPLFQKSTYDESYNELNVYNGNSQSQWGSLWS